MDALPFVSKIEELLPDLPKQEARVAQYLLLNRSDGSASRPGPPSPRSTGTSEVTVSRLLHRLGYRGMRGLKREIEVEATPESGSASAPQERAMLEGQSSAAMSSALRCAPW